MPLILTEEQQMLRDAARGFYAEHAPLTQLRELRDSGDEQGYKADAWQQMIEMGWTGVAIKEEFGGLGFGYTGLGLLLEEGGRTLAASPMVGSVLIGATAIQQAGTPDQQAALLPRIVSGELLLSLAVDEGSRHNPQALDAVLKPDGDGWVLNGNKPNVIDAGVAGLFIVAARLDGTQDLALALVAADAPGVTVGARRNIDSRNTADLSCSACQVSEVLGSGPLAPAIFDRILDVARVGLAAEAQGIAQEVFDRTLTYVRERKQFKVPIGSFQGLQHRLATLYGELELCQSTLLAALQAIDAGSDKLAELASIAKARLSEYGKLACLEAIQMHGGVGVTDEFDFGLYLKRMQVLAQAYGDETFHYDRLATLGGY